MTRLGHTVDPSPDRSGNEASVRSSWNPPFSLWILTMTASGSRRATWAVIDHVDPFHDGLDAVDADACYRAMDWLLDVEPDLAEAVYWATAGLLNLDVVNGETGSDCPAPEWRRPRWGSLY